MCCVVMCYVVQPGKTIPQGATILKLVTTQAGGAPGKAPTMITAGQLQSPLTAVGSNPAQQIPVSSLLTSNSLVLL